MAPWFILASRSPRRRELLELIVPPGRITVVPPRDATEAGFAGMHDLASIERRLVEIAQQKAADVAGQLGGAPAMRPETDWDVIIAADTAVVVTQPDGSLVELGQPPEDASWKETVRHWFRDYYAGRTHLVLTAVFMQTSQGRAAQRTECSKVTFMADVERRLEWYLDSGEPPGKAGGYAIQGAGSVFVSKLEGSLSNVIGLPLEALLEILSELQVEVS